MLADIRQAVLCFPKRSCPSKIGSKIIVWPRFLQIFCQFFRLVSYQFVPFLFVNELFVLAANKQAVVVRRADVSVRFGGIPK
jgi:hypothetical protein